MNKYLWLVWVLLLGSGCRSLHLTGDAQEKLRREIIPVVERFGTSRARGQISRFGYSVPFVTVVRMPGQDKGFTAIGMIPVGAALFQISGQTPAELKCSFTPLVPQFARDHLFFSIQEDLYNIYVPPRNYQSLTINKEGVATFQEQRNDGQRVEWSISAPPRRLLSKKGYNSLNIPSWSIEYQADGKMRYSRGARLLHINLTPIVSSDHDRKSD